MKSRMAWRHRSQGTARSGRPACLQSEAAYDFPLLRALTHVDTSVDGTGRGPSEAGRRPHPRVGHSSLCCLCFLLFSNKIRWRSYSQENGMFALAALGCGQRLGFLRSVHSGEAEPSVSMRGDLPTPTEGDTCWVPAYTQDATVLPQFQGPRVTWSGTQDLRVLRIGGRPY